MKEFQYKIKDEIGIHARPAGLLVQEAKKFESNIMINCRDKKSSAKSLFGIMGMGIKNGDNITVSVEGSDESTACLAIEKFFYDNL